MSVLEYVGAFAVGVICAIVIAYVGLWILAKIMGMPED